MSGPSSPGDDILRTTSDPLDRLLLRVPLAPPDAWFAARTLARCRNSVPASSFFGWNLLRSRWALGGLLGLCATAFTLQQIHHSAKIHSNKQRNLQEAFEIVASIDNDSYATAAQDTEF